MHVIRHAKRLTDRWHRSPDRPEERSTGILHQVPAVRDLHGLRRSLGRGLPVTAAAVTGDNGDFRVSGQPCCYSCSLAVWQQVDDPAPFLRAESQLAWLTDVLRRIVSGQTKRNRLDTLLPWNWKPQGDIAPLNSG